MKKRGQQTMSMPFGMIFSIFLIVVFIVVAFIAAKSFMNFGKCASVGTFYDDLEKEISSISRSQTAEKQFKIILPDGVEQLCFANLSATITDLEIYDEIKYYESYQANTFLLPRGKSCDIPFKVIPNINLDSTTDAQNPYCIDLQKRDELTLKKDFYDKSVTIQ